METALMVVGAFLVTFGTFFAGYQFRIQVEAREWLRRATEAKEQAEKEPR